MSVSRRGFVRTLGVGGVGALALPSVIARGREALSGVAPSASPTRASTTAEAVRRAVIRLDSNENAHGPCPAALDAIGRMFGEACRYPDSPEEELRLAVARTLGLPAGNVLLGCGSTEILIMASKAFISPAHGLVTAAPTFEAPAHVAEDLGAPVVAVRVDDGLRLDLAEMAAKANGAGLVYLCNPNNPTATEHPAPAVADFVSRLLGSSPATTILIDEAYLEFVEEPGYASAIPLAMEQPRVVVTRTFSKIYGLAGLRIGYAVGHADTLATMRRHKLPSGVNVMGAAAALASLDQREHVARQRRLNHEAREFTRRAFESAGYRVVPSETNFFMVDIRRDVKEFQAACRGRDVLVGRPFPPLAGYARISIGTLEEMRRAAEVFRAVL